MRNLAGQCDSVQKQNFNRKKPAEEQAGYYRDLLKNKSEANALFN